MRGPGAPSGPGDKREDGEGHGGRRARLAVPLVLLTLAACAPSVDTSLVDAYLEPQRPAWGSLPSPSPFPKIEQGTRLVGMRAGDLRDVFGDPALVRTEGRVQYWRYGFAGCTLDLFVNTDADGRGEVVYFDLSANDLDGNGGAVSQCQRLAERLDGVERLTPHRSLPPVESF